MAKFLAMTSSGLTDCLQEELKSLNYKVLKKTNTSVLFECSWAEAYRACLSLRTATRVGLPVLDFPAYNEDDLYHNLKKHDFTKYISAKQTLAVQATVSNSGKIKNSHYVQQIIKDSIVDQFSDRGGARPSVDTKNPDLLLLVKVKKNMASVSIDLCGRSLAHRGYRKNQGLAPIREHIAAGLILLTGWKGGRPLIDPTCGSGTFLTEAALIARNIVPGLLRDDFAFKKFKNFNREKFDEVLQKLKSQVQPQKAIIMGSDIDPRAIEAAKENIKNLKKWSLEIQLKQIGLTDLKVDLDEPGLLVSNPPYGERLETNKNLLSLYKDLSHFFKKELSGWDCWVLSGNKEASASLRLKASQRHAVKNGDIDCRWLNYKIN